MKLSKITKSVSSGTTVPATSLEENCCLQRVLMPVKVNLLLIWLSNLPLSV